MVLNYRPVISDLKKVVDHQRIERDVSVAGPTVINCLFRDLSYWDKRDIKHQNTLGSLDQNKVEQLERLRSEDTPWIF